VTRTQPPSPSSPPSPRSTDREILRLAVPAFFALVAEPLFILADSAIVGHLGTPQLAGLGIAGTVLTTLVGLCVFLAYGTTGAVARKVGAGDLRGAVRQGVDGMWLALGIGVVLAAAAALAAPWIVDALGASSTARPYALTYLRISALGIPAMLLVLAATGVLRGLQDTRTPLAVAVLGSVANLLLNLGLVYGLDWGIAGSAWGTVIAQYLMTSVYLTVVVRGAKKHGAPLTPDAAGIKASATAGVPLFIRTVSMRAVFVLAAMSAAHMGDDSIAAHQITFQVWIFVSLALDALAIAGQSIVGKALGAGDTAGTRAATRRMVAWGLWGGVLFAVLLIAARPLYIPLFTGDSAVRDLLAATLVAAALQQPVCGAVAVLDGVLIGAGDGRYLALTMPVPLLVFGAAAGGVWLRDGGVAALWWFGLTGFMLARLAFLWWRYRGDTWLVTGADHPR
jgi:putative MATE family efflux protein